MISNIQDKYILGRWAYKLGVAPIISDAEYNVIHNSFVQLGILPEYTGRTWSEDTEPTELLAKYGIKFKDSVDLSVYADNETITTQHILTSSMMTLDDELSIEQKIKGITKGARMSHKLDGWSIQVMYQGGNFSGALSRGRSTDPLDLAAVEELVPNKINTDLNVTIVGELVTTLAGYRELSKTLQLASPRSAVRPALTRGHSYVLRFVAFAVYVGKTLIDTQEAYTFLNSNGFKVPDNRIIYNYSEYKTAYDELVLLDKSSGLPTDGLVLQNLETYECVALRTNHWENPVYRSYVTGYVPNPGEFDISISAAIYNIRTKSGMQKQVNIYNLSYVSDFRLTPGAPIAFVLESSADAVIQEDITRLLHLEYSSRWEQYKEEVERNEELKRACVDDSYFDEPSVDDVDLQYLGIE